MSLIQVGLVDTTGKINPELVQACAAALGIQVTRDLAPIWGAQATVQYLPHASKIPAGVWPIRLVASLPPGEGGFHQTKHNQPYAEVIATPTDDSWTIDASHEFCEMLVDPSGNKMQSSLAIEISGNGVKDTTGQFNYLVEACDPCEANNYGYTINGILMSDFITPHFYDPAVTPGTRYSFTGAVKAPRQLLPGGYISYVDEAADEVRQILWVDPTKPPQYKNLGQADLSKHRSLRGWVDAVMMHDRAIQKAQHPVIHERLEDLARRDHERREILDKIATKRAHLYHR